MNSVACFELVMFRHSVANCVSVGKGEEVFKDEQDILIVHMKRNTFPFRRRHRMKKDESAIYVYSGVQARLRTAT